MRGNLIAVLAGSLLTTSALAQQPRSDKLESAADNISRMQSALKQVLTQAEQARSEKDVVKLSCVNEKLTQIKSLIKVAEQADIALHESVAAKDTGGEAEFSKIAIARTKVDHLRADSEQCVGQLAFMVDEKTTVEVEQPAALSAGASAGAGVASSSGSPVDANAVIDAMRERFSVPTRVRPPPPGQ